MDNKRSGLLIVSIVLVILLSSPVTKGEEILTFPAGWNFNEKQGNIADDTFENHNGTVNGCTMGHPGMITTCYWFDGIDDYISVEHQDDINFGVSGNFSISLWIKTNQSVSSSIIDKRVYNSTLADYDGYDIELLTNGTIICSIYPTGQTSTVQVISTTDVTDNVWHRVSMVRRDDELFVYIDGVNESSTHGASGDLSNENKLYFGTNTDLNSNYMGYIDLLYITHGAPTDSYILYQYEHYMILPNVPRNLVTISQNGTVNLDWIPGMGGGSMPPMMHFNIYRGTTATFISLYDSINYDDFNGTYIDSNVSVNQTYYYKVSAVNGAGESNYSNTVNATVVSAIVEEEQTTPGFGFELIFLATIIGILVYRKKR